MKINRKQAFAVIMTTIMSLSASGCTSSGNGETTMNDDEIQALIDSAVAEAEKEADRIVEEAIKESETEVEITANPNSEFQPSDEILSADIYSGKVQIQDTVYTYPFTLNDLAANGIDIGVDPAENAASTVSTTLFIGNKMLNVYCTPTDKFGATKGDSVVTTIAFTMFNETPEYYLPGGIGKGTPKSLVVEKYGKETLVDDTVYMFCEEYAEIEGEPYPMYPSNNYYKIVFDSDDKVKAVTLNLDSNSEDVVEWKFPADSYKDKTAVYISTPDYFFDYTRTPPYNYGMKLYEYNGEQYFLRIFEKPEDRGTYLCAVNDPLWEKPVYNYPADYSDESVIERIEKSVYEFDKWGRETFVFTGNLTYNYTKKGDGVFDIVRRINMGSYATIYGECHDNRKSKRITLNVLPCNGTTAVSEEALASLDELVIEMASSIRFETIE